MEILDTVLTWTHIVSASLVLLSGLAAMLIRPKGGRLHRNIGKAYFYGMLVVVLSAVGIIVLLRFNLFLLVIAVFSFYLCFTGYRVLHRKRPGQQTAVDWTGAIIAILSGLALLFIGTKGLLTTGIQPIFILCAVFGSMTALSGWTDVRIFKQNQMDDKMWWWYHHMQSMIGSYIAALSAFLVQNGDRYLPDFPYPWIFWLAPTIVGTPVIVFWIRYYRNKFNPSAHG
jgi:uncharacterized membrane protein